MCGRKCFVTNNSLVSADLGDACAIWLCAASSLVLCVCRSLDRPPAVEQSVFCSSTACGLCPDAARSKLRKQTAHCVSANTQAETACTFAAQVHRPDRTRGAPTSSSAGPCTRVFNKEREVLAAFLTPPSTLAFAAGVSRVFAVSAPSEVRPSRMLRKVLRFMDLRLEGTQSVLYGPPEVQCNPEPRQMAAPSCSRHNYASDSLSQARSHSHHERNSEVRGPALGAGGTRCRGACTRRCRRPRCCAASSRCRRGPRRPPQAGTGPFVPPGILQFLLYVGMRPVSFPL